MPGGGWPEKLTSGEGGEQRPNQKGKFADPYKNHCIGSN